ncbi:hypothetical protein BJ912DRAFT_921453 [Pholiota molesta]|nr:hypothetical protein BJ912DRAFT_921453 [Pholiota molesta]
MYDDEDKPENEKENDHQGGGKWVHKVTGDVLGGSAGLLEFTLTVANEMLSLLGSLQPDPFSPRHIVNQQPEKKDEDEESSASDEDDQDEATDAESGLEEEEEEEEDDSDMDTFRR